MPSQPFKALFLLLLAQFIGLGIVFPYYALTQQDSVRLQVFALVAAAIALFTLVNVWRQKSWAMWAVLTAVSFKLTIDLYVWATGRDRTPLLFVGELINLAIIVLAFRHPMPFGQDSNITRSQKVFFGFVLALAGIIGFFGLTAPENSARVLPFAVPPLHARFLGSMYLSGATFMGLNILAKRWSEVRVVTPMIAIWTGMLGLVSLLHLAAFDWSRIQTFVWFVAYISFPLVAAWITWQQRHNRAPDLGKPLSASVRNYLYLQGAVVTLLALSLLLFPAAMAAIWPWKITPLLAQIYSAPFLAYGLGSFYATTQPHWENIRIVVYATLVFTLAVLISSLLHASLFAPQNVATWLWFGGFALSSLALAMLGMVPTQRSSLDVQ